MRKKFTKTKKSLHKQENRNWRDGYRKCLSEKVSLTLKGGGRAKGVRFLEWGSFGH